MTINKRSTTHGLTSRKPPQEQGSGTSSASSDKYPPKYKL